MPRAKKPSEPDGVPQFLAMEHAVAMGLFLMIRRDRSEVPVYRDPAGHWAEAAVLAERLVAELRQAREAVARLLSRNG